MTCATCGRTRSSAQPSLEFGSIICDPCYRTELTALQDARERVVATATRTHFEEIRHARDNPHIGLGIN